MKLSDLKAGESGIITDIDVTCPIRERMWDMGLVEGTEVTLLRSAPFRGPIEIALRGYHLVLRRVDGEKVNTVRTGRS